MRKNYLVFVLIMCFNHGFSQMDSTDFEETKWGMKTTPRPLFEPSYSIYSFRNKTNVGFSSNNHFPLSPLQVIGFNLNLITTGDAGFLGLITKKDVSFLFHYLLPEEQQLGDTLHFKMQGYHFSINYGKDLWYSNKTLDILPQYGYGFSWLTIHQRSIQETKKYMNPAFVVNIMLELRCNVIPYKNKRLLSFGLKQGMQIDCSNPNWRRNHKITNQVDKLRQTGPFIQFFASFNL